MKTARQLIFRAAAVIAVLASAWAGFAVPASAQESGELLFEAAASDPTCGEVAFTLTFPEGNENTEYGFFMDFGDGDTSNRVFLDPGEFSTELTHTYLEPGEYQWSVAAGELEEAEGTLTAVSSGRVSGTTVIDGPALELTSEPFPPLVTLDGGEASVEFSTSVSGGSEPYTYSWDLDGDSVDDGISETTAEQIYTEGGKFTAAVTVTDSCGFSTTETLPVVVVDPEEEDSCHPTAKKIADAVNSIFPDQANDLYTCEDVFNMFEGSLTGGQLGFGRMWHAYQLSQTIEDLTWEEIRDWHLEQSGWGTLLQLDRFADLLEDHSITDLMGLVTSEDYSLQDVRTAVRSATRYEADFEDALNRISEGTSPGELGQFYSLVQELETDPVILDEYLAAGLTLPELKHSAKFADQVDAEWTEIVDARSAGDSWGDLKQAYKLADEETSAADILAQGVQEYRAESRTENRNENTAGKLSEKFNTSSTDIMALFEGECDNSWGCVRKTLREQEQTSTQAQGPTEKDQRTAMQIAARYLGIDSEDEVLEYHVDVCEGDWSCTRAHFRELARENKQTGKPEHAGPKDKNK